MNQSTSVGKTGRKAPRSRWLLILVAALLCLDYFAYPYGVPAGGHSGNIGENGLWLGYAWYFGQHSLTDVDRLDALLASGQIRYAYFHVRSMQHTGLLTYHYPDAARKLVAEVHAQAPNAKAIAWIYAGNSRGLGAVDLKNVAVRRNMVAQAVWLVNDCGFDGVQWDYEICPNGDTSFLKLLAETRAALPAGTILGVASPICIPGGFVGWDSRYFGVVARRCDQIAVMNYDTAAYFPRVYVWLTHQQVVRVSQAIARANPNCRVLIGLPTYPDGTRSHNPRAENMVLALRGVRQGIADANCRPSVIAGVATYIDFTTTRSDWSTYRRQWPVSLRDRTLK